MVRYRRISRNVQWRNFQFQNGIIFYAHPVKIYKISPKHRFQNGGYSYQICSKTSIFLAKDILTYMYESYISTQCDQDIYKPGRKKTYRLTCVPNLHTNQSAHPCNLIRVSAVRKKKLCILGYVKSAQRRFWSDCANLAGWSESLLGADVLWYVSWGFICTLQKARLAPVVFAFFFFCHSFSLPVAVFVSLMRRLIWIFAGRRCLMVRFLRVHMYTTES